MANTFRSAATAALVGIAAAAIPAKSVDNIGASCAPLRAVMEGLKGDPTPNSQAEVKAIANLLPSCGVLEIGRRALERSGKKLDEIQALRGDIENFASKTGPAPQ